MPDISAVVSPLMDLLGPLVGQAVRAFLGTTVGMVCLGVVLGGGAFVSAARVSLLHGLLAAVVVLATCAVIGGILASKRAVGAALARGIGEVGLARKTTHWLFTQMLGVDEKGTTGDRGGAVATTLERLPLAEAERRLSAAVDRGVAPAPGATGLRAWFQRKLQVRLLNGISRVTLAEFRAVAGATGGVDLVRVRDDLGGRVDAMLRARVEGGTRKLTIMLVVACVVLAVASTLAIQRIEW